MIKSIIAAFVFAAFTPIAAAQTAPAPEAAAVQGETVIAKVNGMVCDFCARAVAKVFGKEDAVADISIDLNAGDISIAMKPGRTLDDARIADLVRKSGYALVAIERTAA